MRPVREVELRDAARFGLTGDAARAFAVRQRAARLRVALLDAFYARYPCRMGTLQQLATAGIALARFAALSEAYHEIGDRLLPVDRDGLPRHAAWRAYVDACDRALPSDIREERWLAAHVLDMEQVKADGWMERFAEERAAHVGDPTWDMLGEHMDVTLGTRVADREALAGHIALETAMATSLNRVARRQLVTGARLIRTYVLAAVRATLWSRTPPDGLPGDRALVCRLCLATLKAASITRVWRLGIRRQARGVENTMTSWSLVPSLEQVLGPDAARMHPVVRRLFHEMHGFRMEASVHLYHSLGWWAAFAGSILMGQGMYEQHLAAVDARFRLFQRADGSLHFLREFWCEDAVRTFDSDFVVREVDGKPTIIEVFADLGLAARMRTEVMDDGGVSMTVVGLFLRGVPVGVGPFHVCFETHPVPGSADRVDVSGVMDLRPRNAFERWWFHRVWGLPARIGEIRYYADPVPEVGAS